MGKAYLRLIGDVHGNYEEYKRLCDGAEYTIQVGDLAGRSYHILETLDPARHRVLAGNHDIYDRDHPEYFRNYPHFLEDWGTLTIPDFGDIFYVRGAWSIDEKSRKRLMDMGSTDIADQFWEESELTYPQLEQAIMAYREAKPDFVVTHECPFNILGSVSSPQIARNHGFPTGMIRNRTNQALEMMFEYHQPKQWLFGHYHRRWEGHLDGTDFTCLPICRYYDIPWITPEFHKDFPKNG